MSSAMMMTMFGRLVAPTAGRCHPAAQRCQKVSPVHHSPYIARLQVAKAESAIFAAGTFPERVFFLYE